MRLKIFRFPHGEFLPSYGTKYSAGMDLYSVDTLEIKPMERALVGTGIGIILPKLSAEDRKSDSCDEHDNSAKSIDFASSEENTLSNCEGLRYEAQIRSRSGLALKHGVIVLNSPGTIDADYHDEIKVILINLGSENFVVKKGMRIAQMVISRCVSVVLDEVNYDSVTSLVKNRGGFGSTGK